MLTVLILSLILLITAILALTTYIRLYQASKKFKNPEAFENDCHVSVTYVQSGILFMSAVIFVSLLYMYLFRYSDILTR
jgi:UDP-N-acetylmuramyl pentapeptide phosphotransferase/UDP-N-acetylglucosamine-1-phosphate transferase